MNSASMWAIKSGIMDSLEEPDIFYLQCDPNWVVIISGRGVVVTEDLYQK